ncbi:hypothetical protein [Streptomyces sp. MP131-18]|uniref:DUF6197 family protein n=1 Tax=Streptomyces sp. MP131-18 TaxID=1857892 RepID=UPI00097BB319|nr:hypothetical protein [Streptomyces sp. MP131-18]ONK13098.1 hypothetical protein STBA_38600 [Streptomyces sp. MP131-18]
MSMQTALPSPAVLAEVYRAAAQLIAERGLFRGGFSSIARSPEERCYCTVAAIRVAAGVAPDDDGHPVAEAAIRRLAPMVDPAVINSDPVERVAAWNDRPERTTCEVVATLNAAAEDAEGDGRHGQ